MTPFEPEYVVTRRTESGELEVVDRFAADRKIGPISAEAKARFDEVRASRDGVLELWARFRFDPGEKVGGRGGRLR